MPEPRPNRYRCVLLRRSGASEILVVQAESEAAARALLAAEGRDPVKVEPIGPTLLDSLRERGPALPRWPMPELRRRLPGRFLPSRAALIPAGLILATIPVSTALGAWGLTAVNRWQAARIAQAEAPALARYERVAAVERSRARVAAVMTVPSLTAVTARLARLLPGEAGLAGLSLSETGDLTVEIETADPDALRGALAADPLFARMDEVSQTRTDGASIHVTLRGRIA